MACRYTYQGKTYEAHEFDDVLRAMPIAEAAKYMPGVSSLPAAPFIDDTGKWLNLALRRVIKMAVDEGYDAVAFVNGEQSADRYDLSKQITSLAVYRDGDGYKVSFTAINGGTQPARRVESADELADTIGKELAKKAIEDLGERRSMVNYTGLDLKVGGEGMKAFYDQIVPQAASALVKKLGGEGLATVSIAPSQPHKFSALPGAGNDWVIYDSVKEEWIASLSPLRMTNRVAQAAAMPRSDAEAGADMAMRLTKKPGGMTQPGFAITDKMRQAASGPLPLFSRERGWGDFPDAVIASPLSAQTKDADYTAAKAGDVKAASRLVGRVLPQEAIDQVRQLIGDLKPVVLPVSAEEAAGRNKIPLATAARLAGALNLDIDVDIVQATRARRSGADGMARLGLQPEFDGQVQSGRDYLLVDDTLTQGGTLAQLKTYVEAGGGRVIGAFALGGKQYSAKIGLDADTLSRLRDKYGSVEDWWRSELGFGFHGLTQSEARYILASGLAPEALRDRVAAARREAGASQGDARLSRERDTDNPNFAVWSGGAPLVRLGEKREFRSGEAVVVEALHGTTNASLAEFRRDRANVESDFGAGFYASNTPEDVATNYANISGPDLTVKRERLAERFAQELEEDPDWADRSDKDRDDEAHRRAAERLTEFAPNTMKLYVRFKNPAVLGGNGETYFDYSEEYDEATDRYKEPTGLLVDFVNALDEAGDGVDLSMRDLEQAKAAIWEAASAEGLGLGDLAKIVKEKMVDAQDVRSGDSASSELLRQALEGMGFDGVIDTTVSKKFKGMKGMNKDTVHFIAFKPTQLKSATGNRGAFDPTDPDITRSRERAAWTPERVDDLIDAYAYTMNDAKTKAYAGWVSPADYLAATTPADEVASLEAERTPLDAAALADQRQPIMIFGELSADLTWKTDGHEGRHRMMALRDAGVRNVPVVFKMSQGAEADVTTGVYVTPQRWGDTKAQKGFMVGLTPISYKFKDEVKRKFGGDGDIRFSRERTETPEFKAWFKDSKVVDEQGRPLVVYHGIPHEFEGGAFRRRKSRTGNDSFGFHFGTSLAANDRINGAMERAKQFPSLAAYEGIAPAVMPVYLSIRNPARLEDIGAWHKAEWVNKALERAGIDAQAPTLAKIKARLVELGYDGVVYLNKFEGGEKDESYIALDPRQIKSAIGNDGSFDETDPSILSSAARSWETPGASKFDDAVQKMQDKNVDLLRVQQALADAGREIGNDRDAYLKEELFHGRAAKRTEDFTKRELEPLTEEMAKRGLTIEELDEYLHARHAPEANRLVAERNPDVDALQDGGSGMTNKQAADYMAGLAADKREHLQAVAAKVDKMLARTRQLMAEYELESADTVKGWGSMFEHYVPLMREDDGDAPQRLGTGQGYSIKGREVKSRTGSTKKVVDILANIALQRERTIVRGEKNRVGQALVNLARENPNKDFWEVDLAPTTPTYDPKKGVVVQRPDPMFKMRPNVLVAKFREADGSVKEHAVIFNEKSERALRAAASLKNLEAARMEGFLGGAAAVTRYFSAIVTQYNPVFGIINFMRDFQAVMLNLKSTPLDGLQKQIAADSMRATKQIYQNLRSGKDDGDLQKLWDEFRNVGGQTGFRQLYADSADRADAIREAINPDAWTDTKLGKIFTANGVLKVPMAKAMRASKGLFQWLTDYNDTLENATRLAVYKAGKAKFLADGMAKQEAMEKAASIAKNISANFNRKGELGQQIGALYAFFNAAMQGTARLGQLLFDMEPGKPKTIRLSRVGKRIVTGGVLLGVGQALALAAAGFSDDDPPEFVRERSLVIPTGGKSYISIPMPLGLHVLPNIGRMATEWAMSGFDKTPQRAVAFIGLLAEAFVPTGSSGLSMQTLAPTAVDPLVALTENRDWQGRPIAKESMNPAVPGHALVKDTATAWSRVMAEAINYATGGNQYLRGAVSPTPDQLDYLIAALGGGVANEISKVQQTAGSLVTGESLPTYKIPLVGRLVGNAASQQSEGTAFYSTSRKLNELETEIKGLQADGRQQEAQELRASRPEAYLIAQVNRAERDISKLRKQKSELIAAGAPREQVRAIEEKITARMAAFNQAAAAAQARRAT